MSESTPMIQDSAVAGDVHVGDVHNTTQNTHVDQSTNIHLPNIDVALGEKVIIILKTVFGFVGGIIGASLLFTAVIALGIGFLVYNGKL